MTNGEFDEFDEFEQEYASQSPIKFSPLKEVDEFDREDDEYEEYDPKEKSTLYNLVTIFFVISATILTGGATLILVLVYLFLTRGYHSGGVPFPEGIYWIPPIVGITCGCFMASARNS